MDLDDLRRFAFELSKHLGLRIGFSAVLLSDRGIWRYNRQFAGKNRATDVLSFPDTGSVDDSQCEPYLGDILISVETADRQREASLQVELKILLLHGLLHLLGYDHEVDQGEMGELERNLRMEFGFK